MNILYFQKGFNYSQDGPGNRLVYHLQGCNMRCPWCANPEGLALSSRNASSVTVEDLVQEIVSSKLMFFDGGGVTFTGGEATLQFTSLQAALRELKRLGIDTCIETNGASPNLLELAPFIDHLIIDLKHYDEEKHRQVVGIGNERIKENLGALADSGKEILIRTPLIHGFNDEVEDIEGFLAFYKTLPLEKLQFELLSFHEYGKDKWAKLGLGYQMVDGYIKPEVKQEYERKYRENGLQVVRT